MVVSKSKKQREKKRLDKLACKNLKKTQLKDVLSSLSEMNQAHQQTFNQVKDQLKSVKDMGLPSKRQKREVWDVKKETPISADHSVSEDNASFDSMPDEWKQLMPSQTPEVRQEIKQLMPTQR